MSFLDLHMTNSPLIINHDTDSDPVVVSWGTDRGPGDRVGGQLPSLKHCPAGAYRRQYRGTGAVLVPLSALLSSRTLPQTMAQE